MLATAERRDLIRQLLLDRPVRSQAELQELLESRGIQVSQPVISRDLRALHVAKLEGTYHVHEEERVTPLAALASLLRSAGPVAAFERIGCEPGAASAVARALEAEELDGLVGTVAGDDTVLALLSSKAAGARVRELVQRHLED